MPGVSAGLVLFRRRSAGLEVLLVHPGGPYYIKKDRGVWSIPKGEVEVGEDLLAAAQREFFEETGFAPHGPYLPLGGVKYRNHKIVYAWACEGDCNPEEMISFPFALEWPPRSGVMREFPEADRAAFFALADARDVILPAQRRFIDDLPAVAAAAARQADAGDVPGSEDMPAGGD